MPASRRNAATTRLPRSCPSRPILVTSTLGGWTVLVGLIMHPGYGRSIYGEPPPARCEGWISGALVKRSAEPTTGHRLHRCWVSASLDPNCLSRDPRDEPEGRQARP